MQNFFSKGIQRLMGAKQGPMHGARQAVVLCLATVKGGVGKTTTAVNLACGLAQTPGTRVLLIDLDAQGHCTTSLAGSLPSDSKATPLHEVLLHDPPLEVLEASTPSGIKNLDLTLAAPGLAEAEGRMSQKIGKEQILRDALRVTRTHYDYIVIDCPPNKGTLTLNALMASDHVIIPTDLSPLAVQGADELMSTAALVNQRLGHSLGLLGVLLTRYDGRNVSVNRTILEQMEEAWGDLLFQTRVGINTALSQAQIKGLSIFDSAPKSRGATHYRALTKEVLQRLADLPE